MEQVQSLILNPLKPYLLPITTNLPTPISNTLTSLLGAPCHDALLRDLDIITHPECLSLAISKALGIAIITTASIVKVPQILKLLQSQSAAGLSFTSYVLETASFLITLAYNVRSGWPFSTYGETALILAQDVVIAVLVLHFTRRDGMAGGFVAGVAAVIYALLVSDTLVDAKLMNYLQAGAGVLSIASKLPQILTVYKEGGTGQLSAFAVFNYMAGSLSRIFTTLQEVDDMLILYGFVAGFVLNAVLAGQMVYYWNEKGPTAGHGGEISEKIPQAVGQTSGAEVKKGVAGSTIRRG
jgi:mannose-P-dolichol utilization defect 1